MDRRLREVQPPPEVKPLIATIGLPITQMPPLSAPQPDQARINYPPLCSCLTFSAGWRTRFRHNNAKRDERERRRDEEHFFYEMERTAADQTMRQQLTNQAPTPADILREVVVATSGAQIQLPKPVHIHKISANSDIEAFHRPSGVDCSDRSRLVLFHHGCRTRRRHRGRL